MENLEDLLAREGVEVETSVPPPISGTFQFASAPGIFFLSNRYPGIHISPFLGGSSPPKGYPYVPPGPHMIPPGYPPMPPYYPAPPGAPYPPPPHMQPPPGYNPHLHPLFQHPPQQLPSQHIPPVQPIPRPLSSAGLVSDIKGGDPGAHDMSNPRVRP